MCGIYGMVAPQGAQLRRPELAARLGERVRHRGPDGHGRCEHAHVLLGAERLRIQDLSPLGDQPFRDPTDRVWLVCNGEVYNAPELRRRFPAYRYASGSDVEVALPLYLAGGPEALADLSGMFALAIWDDRMHTLVLARDRAGEKPLFHASVEGERWFASDIAALLEHPALSRELDQDGLDEYLTLSFTRAPRTMLRAVRSVEPGTVEVHTAGSTRVIRYWDPTAIPESPVPAAAAAAEAQALIMRAVAAQMRADVHVGVFTSGGVDSSLLAALATRSHGRPLCLFTAAFTAPTYDESRHAGALAASLGARHVLAVVDEGGLSEAFDTLTESIGEPIADPAALPTYLLSRTARHHVGVVLSGEGADELFGGYPTYLGHRLAPGFAALPSWIRRAARAALRRLPPSRTKVPLTWLANQFADLAGRPWPDRHVGWMGSGLPADIFPKGAPSRAQLLPPNIAERAALEGALLFDYVGYLGSRLLPKLDRATMLVALEARAPYLDRDLTTFALGLPAALKVRGVETKWLLKRIAAPLIPPSLVHRRKRGLSVPLSAWLSGGLRCEVDRLLAPARLRRQGLVSDVSVRRLVAEHQSGHAGHARGLWTLLVLQRWLERWVP